MSQRDEQLLAIGEVARRSGMSVSRIRFYESCGVLAEPQRQAGKRRYSPDVITQLAIVDAAQRVGFSLEEIRTWCGGEATPRTNACVNSRSTSCQRSTSSSSEPPLCVTY